jgi:hypothetical protein
MAQARGSRILGSLRSCTCLLEQCGGARQLLILSVIVSITLCTMFQFN